MSKCFSNIFFMGITLAPQRAFGLTRSFAGSTFSVPSGSHEGAVRRLRGQSAAVDWNIIKKHLKQQRKAGIWMHPGLSRIT
jgi:hypothetical protein